MIEPCQLCPTSISILTPWMDTRQYQRRVEQSSSVTPEDLTSLTPATQRGCERGMVAEGLHWFMEGYKSDAGSVQPRGLKIVLVGNVTR